MFFGSLHQQVPRWNRSAACVGVESPDSLSWAWAVGTKERRGGEYVQHSDTEQEKGGAQVLPQSQL